MNIVSNRHIVNTINKYVKISYDLTPVWYSGTEFKTKNREEYIKLSVTTFSSKPQRRCKRQIRDIQIIIKIVKKLGSNVTRINEIMDRLEFIFHQKDIPIVGGCLIRCGEAESANHENDIAPSGPTGTSISEISVATFRIMATVQ